MTVQDIKVRETYQVWMKTAASSEGLPGQGSGFLKPDEGAPGRYIFTIGGDNGVERAPLLEPAAVEHTRDMEFNFRQGNVCVAEIVSVAEPEANGKGQEKAYRRADLRLVFFNGQPLNLGSLPVCCGEKVVDSAMKKKLDLSGKFLERFVLTLQGVRYAVMQLWQKNGKKEEKAEPQAGAAGTETAAEGEIKTSTPETFTLHGAGVRLPCVMKKMGVEGDTYLYADSIKRSNREPPANLFLVRADLSFVTVAERIAAIAKNTLELLNEQDSEFLKLWNTYITKEKEVFLKRMREVGAIPFKLFPQKAERHWTFFMEKELPKKVQDVLKSGELVLTVEKPSYLVQTEKTTAEIETEWNGLKDNPLGKVTECASNSITLKFAEQEDESKFASGSQKYRYLSCVPIGNLKQIKRRIEAWERLTTATSGNPLLASLLTLGDKYPDTGRKAGHIKPLSWYVEHKIFSKPPTQNQIDAISLALNTPDIALIQGPPGTGKTTVIAAIAERLNEEQDKTGDVQGRILLSAFQHSAVENILERLSINALPTFKFGGRRREGEDSQAFMKRRLTEWVEKTTERVRAQAAAREAMESDPLTLAQAERENRLASLLGAYTCEPSIENARALLLDLKILPGLPRELLQRADDFFKKLRRGDAGYGPGLLQAVRSLRCNPADFADDGPARARDLRLSLVDADYEPEEAGKTLLDAAAAWKPGAALPDFAAMTALKIALLDEFIPRPAFAREADEGILELFGDVRKWLFAARTPEEKQRLILAEYLEELENNPVGVKDAVRSYSYAFASTTQQSAGRDLALAKTDAAGARQPFDVVIVDEAARATPPDLLIPLVKARRQVILVGDHRQLPHMVDDETAEALDLDEGQEEMLKEKSMFEYLFGHLKELEAKDGIRRLITLDTQYRMHPLLGEFASGQFYEQYGEGFKSGRPESDFDHALSGIEGKAAVWLDVPRHFGPETACNPSYKRVEEAKMIARHLGQWLKEDAGKDLTFGVISFYGAQVAEIKATLKREGADLEKINAGGKERVKIGTVDSFQGMEFDVVFLSVVRSPANSRGLETAPEGDEALQKAARRVFGFLTSEHRLCVSMTRQKKVLVVAGDSGLVRTPLGQAAVPALGAFYDLCKEKGVIL